MRAVPSCATSWRTTLYSVAAAHRLSGELGLSPAVAAILARRGYADVEEARRFLAGDERHDAFEFAGMEETCRLILEHVERGSRILVHGDYDVDGVCSTAILVRVLRLLGAEPSWHLPSRFDEGYGVSRETVERAAARGTGLLITADCGVSAVGEVERALELGMDVVVTDHHRPGERLPPCPVVHPVAGGYPFDSLCAAGVAHKLAEALLASSGGQVARAGEDLDLVAVATVADVVPLAGENRRLVRSGLRALGRTRKPGLRALMRVAALDAGAISAHAVGFRLAPRLNAAGRLGRADAALELLLTPDEDRAAKVADELDLLNRERQSVETGILFAAEAAVAEQSEQAAYVIAGEGWHPGVIGIVASRLVELHHRPCVVVALDGDGGRGSGRSIAAYDLHAGLAACSSHLRRFGGHRAAAGLEIDAVRVEPFRRALAAHAAYVLPPGALEPVEPVDAVVPGGSLGLELAEELERLGPFGHGNPRPALLVPAAAIGAVTAMGEEGRHSRFTVSSGGARARAVAFRTSQGTLAAAAEAPQDAAVTLELNEWNGAVEPRLVLRALCRTRVGLCEEVTAGEDFWTAVDRELLATDPSRWATSPVGGTRTVCDRRGEGVAGVAGDLLTSGESVLLVCADVARRRATLAERIAGLSPTESVRLASWDALAAAPALAAPFEHIVAVDPPPAAVGEEVLAAAPAAGEGFAHLAFGPAEAEFALRVAERGLDLRDALAEVYRGLRDRSGPNGAGAAGGSDLEEVLRGGGPYPREPATCGWVLRVLTELGLVSLDRPAAGGPVARLAAADRTELERSPAFRAYRQRLAEAERYLGALIAARPEQARRPAVAA